jgi:hypothetical protein
MVYLSKSIGQAAGLTEHATDAHRDHARRLHAELRITPCSPRCPLWLLYGIQPQGTRHSITPGHCKGKAHQPQHLGIAGRRVLASRKWSKKTLDVPLCSTSTRIAQRYISAGQSPNRRASGGGGGGRSCRFRRFQRKSQIGARRTLSCSEPATLGSPPRSTRSSPRTISGFSPVHPEHSGRTRSANG